MRRGGGAPVALDPRGDALDDFEIHVGRAQRQPSPLRMQQHIGENRDRGAPFDDALHVAQRLQEGCPFDGKFHGSARMNGGEKRSPVRCPAPTSRRGRTGTQYSTEPPAPYPVGSPAVRQLCSIRRSNSTSSASARSLAI